MTPEQAAYERRKERREIQKEIARRVREAAGACIQVDEGTDGFVSALEGLADWIRDRGGES